MGTSPNRHKKEKTPKTGTVWSREEIQRVMDLYQTPEGKRIHENNRDIQKLAQELNRTTRSVEAQLLMFRALDRGMNYSRNRMSSVCADVWGERAIKKNVCQVGLLTAVCHEQQVTSDNIDHGGGHMSVAENTSADTLATLTVSLPTFPAGLLRWAGHRDGGVRKPFRSDSGRPTGEHMRTPLVDRLDIWVDQFVKGDASVPSTILLVGGPGNGKTDAIEGLVERLDHEIGAKGKLVKMFASQYDATKVLYPPRKVTACLSDAVDGLPPHLCHSVNLVQDATEEDESQRLSAEELLLSDLKTCLTDKSGDIYLCCVNRGILAQAAAKAHADASCGDAAALLDKITQAVTSGAEAPTCWPLEGFPNVAVWPMDVESLVDARLAPQGKTFAHHIFLAALREDRWRQPCASGSLCPFCQNRKLLSKPEALDALVLFLRNYELASGKRWTFRDLFSLVPYLLVGDYTDLSVQGRSADPCEWTAEQLRLIRTPGGDSSKKGRALFLLVSRLYYHRLFPRWPRLSSGLHHSAKTVLRNNDLTPGIETASHLFRYLAWAPQGDANAAGDIPAKIRASFSDALDPALATGNDVLTVCCGKKYSINEIEELFSLSVADGFNAVKSQLEPLECELLKGLATADAALVEDNFSRARSHDVEILRSSLRQFTARLVKRSLGTRSGLCKDHGTFAAYRSVLDDANGLAEVRRQLRRLMHDEHNRFRAPLTTTFGQPVAQRARDVVLLAPAVAVRDIPEIQSAGRPRRTMPYIKIESAIVPLTFALFRALREVVAGLHDASLPPDIFALLNGVKLIVSGHIVHKAKDLDDDAFISIGGVKDLVEVSSAGFVLVKEDRT